MSCYIEALTVARDMNVGKSRYCSYCYETISLVMVFLMMSVMSKEEGFYVHERPLYINVLVRMSTSGSEC